MSYVSCHRNRTILPYSNTYVLFVYFTYDELAAFLLKPLSWANTSCETALLAATDYWMAEVDKGNVVGTLLIDLSKAFDSVNHEQLLLQLKP